MAGDAVLATAILAGMCLLMWVLARLAKRRMGVGSGVVSPGALRVVGKRPLDQKSALWVVEIAGGRHVLLGSGADGTVSKLDDISAEEYAAMVADEAPAARPRLRVARGTDAEPTDGDAGDEAVATGAEQRFATIGESFTHFLGKARDARTARAERKASGDD